MAEFETEIRDESKRKALEVHSTEQVFRTVPLAGEHSSSCKNGCCFSDLVVTRFQFFFPLMSYLMSNIPHFTISMCMFLIISLSILVILVLKISCYQNGPTEECTCHSKCIIKCCQFRNMISYCKGRIYV